MLAIAPVAPRMAKVTVSKGRRPSKVSKPRPTSAKTAALKTNS